MPEELTSYLATHVVQAGAGVRVGGSTLTVGQFCARYAGNARPHKITALN
jgi:hypothetical protein